MRRAVVLAAASASAFGCGVGLRTGASVSRTTAPVELMSTIGEPSHMADASLSGRFLELETIAEYYHVRGMAVLGVATGHARYRSVGPAGVPIFANDDDIIFRAGAGIGFAGFHLGPVRPVPYFLYAINPLTTENVVKHSTELGVDIELESRDKVGALAVVFGVALLRDTGLSYADFATSDTYMSEYTSTGILFTFGFHGIATGLFAD